MLIPFLMFSLDSDKAKSNTPLLWTGKQSDDFGRSLFSIRNVANRKIVQKKPNWDTFLLGIFQVNQKLHFFGGPTLPPSGPVL